MRSSSRLLPALALALGAVLAAPGAASALTPVSEMKDVPANHWAYAAIQNLVEKYQVMDGFPDKTFRGPRTLTRYELAAALQKVMAKVETMIGAATGQPVNLDPTLAPEDLRTIARLQREFRDELEALKSRVETVEQRTAALEKRAKVSGESRLEYRDYMGSDAIATAPLADLRARNRVDLDAALADDLAFHGNLVLDVYGAPSLGDAFATGRGASGAAFTDVYVGNAYAAYAPRDYAVYAGLVNPSAVLTLGSGLANGFTSNVWREATGGYGFVGTPGMTAGAAPALTRLGGTPDGAAWWLPGTDVALQALDPNATQGVFPRTNGTVAATGAAGPFRASLAYYQPGLAGRDASRLGALGYAASLPQPEAATGPSRMIAQVGGDFGPVRLNLAAKTPGSFLGGYGDFNKTLTASVDVGDDALGLNVQAVSRTAFTGQFAPTGASATLASSDLFGTGFGLGLGANVGSVLDTRLDASQAVYPAAAKSLLQGTAGIDYGSYGLYLKVPGFSILPSLTFAAQQTAGAGFGTTVASGFTAQADLQLFGLPRMQAEYSLGKFAAGADNGLLNNASGFTHTQLALQMVVPF